MRELTTRPIQPIEPPIDGDQGPPLWLIATTGRRLCDHVFRSEDTENTVFVELVGSATDQDAHDVWCDVIGQSAIDWQVSVAVENDQSLWNPPKRCSDPAAVPSPV